MNFDEEIYRKKYLKYKAKYLELKGGADYSGTWNNEGIYVGSITSNLLNKIRNGNGKMTYVDNSVYEGKWKEDKRNGKGKMIYADSSIYDGDWVDDNHTGKGKMIFVNNSTYDGAWKDNKKEGKGTYIIPKTISIVEEYVETINRRKVNKTRTIEKTVTTTYDGDWKNDKNMGKGKMTYSDNSVYEGD